MTRIREITPILIDVDNSATKREVSILNQEILDNSYYYKNYQLRFAIEHIQEKLLTIEKDNGCILTFPS